MVNQYSGRMMRRLPAAAAALLAAMLLWLAIPPAAAEKAEAGIELSTELGFQSVYKTGKYARLKLTLTNRTGHDLRGDIIFTLHNGYPTEIAVPVELPRDTPIVAEMTVPGLMYNKDNNLFRFEEGGAGSGRTIPLLTDRPYLETYGLTNEQLIGVIARDPDTLNFLAMLNTQGYAIRTITVKEDDLPTETLQLDALDYLVINDAPTGGWPREKIDAIRGWIMRGGHLIVSGGAGYAKTAEAFADLVPVVPGGTAVLEKTATLEAVGGEPFASDAPITVSTGTLQAGSVILSDGVTIAAARNYGEGSVVYAAFDPSLEPFKSWGGSYRLWERMLNNSGLQQVIGVHVVYGYDFWDFDHLLNYFPSLKPPEIDNLLIYFVIYVLIAAPVLYLVLKRLDRREWAWWMIPALSIVCSVVIFSVGAADKMKVHAHSLRTVQLAGDGWAERSAAAAVFAPSGGTLPVSFGAAEYAMPLRDDPIVQAGGAGSLESRQAVRVTDGELTAVWRNVPYWSIRKAWVHLGPSPGYGQFDTDMSYSGNSIDLRVTNQTAADLTHVHVLMSSSAYRIGDLKRGESGTISIPYQGGQMAAGQTHFGSLIFPRRGRDDPYIRERGLLEMQLNVMRKDRSRQIGPQIVGFSADNGEWLEVSGAPVSSDNVTLWIQPLDLSAVESDGIASTVQPHITKNTLQSHGYTGYNQQVHMREGTVEFEYKMPVREQPYRSFNLLNSELQGPGSAVLEVWNEAAAIWEPVPAAAGKYTLPEPAPSYLTDQLTVKMQLTVTGDIQYRLPDLEWEGGTAE